MQSKLQDITEKIYQEGVEKGNTEGQKIVETAKHEAEKMLAEAKLKAEGIVDDAKKQAQETQTNTENEIKLSAKQAINGLKQQVTDLINNAVVEKAVGESFADKAFIQQVIDTTLKNWSAGGAESMNIDVLLPEADKEAIIKHMTGSVKEMLDKGVEVKTEATLTSGFQIAAKDGSYKVSFSDEDFAAFFKQYLRPKLIDILFS